MVVIIEATDQALFSREKMKILSLIMNYVAMKTMKYSYLIIVIRQLKKLYDLISKKMG